MSEKYVDKRNKNLSGFRLCSVGLFNLEKFKYDCDQRKILFIRSFLSYEP